MEYVAFGLIGICIGLLAGRLYDIIFVDSHPRGRWCAIFHDKTRNSYSPAVLAYEAKNSDKFVAVKLYDSGSDTFREIPMFISREKVRFYHDDGEPIRKESLERLAQ